ncbi:hypothetical protein HMPREF9371_2159 [Neisseria shayeganii 871]|uniref:Uncharacterized protein n=1 Tax=Neisseria shayeganii 871 TaxID=1032488 RepID=G4CKL9_9NEIS|nr:hypothetical protein HMPREF9371_2159 [Neisseria shayeganii 871]
MVHTFGTFQAAVVGLLYIKRDQFAAGNFVGVIRGADDFVDAGMAVIADQAAVMAAQGLHFRLAEEIIAGFGVENLQFDVFAVCLQVQLDQAGCVEAFGRVNAQTVEDGPIQFLGCWRRRGFGFGFGLGLGFGLSVLLRCRLGGGQLADRRAAAAAAAAGRQ